MADLTPDRLAKLRRIAAELRRIAAETTPGTYEWRIIETALELTIETALALLDRIEALEQERDAARAEAERLKAENEHLYSRIERLEARAARQRVMLYRLQEAIERRNSEERIEAMRRALHDETVERYMREYDAAADEAERWRQQYEELRETVVGVVLQLTHGMINGQQAEAQLRTVLADVGGGDQ